MVTLEVHEISLIQDPFHWPAETMNNQKTPLNLCGEMQSLGLA
jgi:hypothetical protein